MVASKHTRVWKSAAARRLLALACNAASVEDAVQIVASDTIKGVPHPPLPLEALTERLRITTIESEDIPFSGELRPCAGGYKIVCSAHLSPARRRFTIAHEMAHAIFETTGANCPRTGAELERLCDMLATELLMPRTVFLDKAGSDPGIETIFELARIFETSLAATAIRCAELLNLSTFQADTNSVTWSYGVVQKGPIRYLDSDLQRLIADGMAGGKGEILLRLSTHRTNSKWHVRYHGTKKQGVIFLLRPASRHQLSVA